MITTVPPDDSYPDSYHPAEKVVPVHHTIGQQKLLLFVVLDTCL